MSHSSDETGLNEEDIKMQRLLAEWDENDDDGKDDLYVDSDDEDGGGDKKKLSDDAKKKALLAGNNKKSRAHHDDDDDEDEDDEDAKKKKALLAKNMDDDDDDEEEEEVEEEEESEDEEEVEEEVEVDDEDEDDTSDKERGSKTKVAKDASKSRGVASGGGTDDDDGDEEGGIVIEPNDPEDDNIEDTLKKKPKKEKKSKTTVKKITEVDPNDDPEAAAMKALLAGWGGDENDDDDDDDDDDDSDEDDTEQSEREVELVDGYLDHIILAAPDLEEAQKDFERMAGVEPVVAGTIKGLGIKCARVSFNDATYLEIIAPDPESPGPIGQLIKNRKINTLTPFHYAIRTSKAESLKDEVKKFGYTPDHISMFSAKKDGTPRKWEMLFLYKHKLGGICPFFINWANSDHPCATLPIVGKLKKFTIRAPEDDPVHDLLAHVQVQGIMTSEVGTPKLSFQFSSPEGTVKFATTKPVGYKFPGFDGDDDDDDTDNNVEFEPPKKPDLLPVNDKPYEDLPDEY